MRIHQITVLLFLQLFLTAQSPQLEEITIEDGLSQGMIFSIVQTQDDFLWIATKDGLNRYDGYNFKIFEHDSYNLHSIAENDTRSLLEDSRGLLWIGLQSGNVDVYDGESGKFFHIPISVGNPTSISSIVEDNNGNIWIGGGGLLTKLEIANDFLQKLKGHSHSSIELAQKDFSHLMNLPTYQVNVRQLIFSMQEEALYIGGGRGFYFFDEKDSKLQLLEGESKINSQQGYFGIQDNGCVWLATDEGLGYKEKGQLQIIDLPIEARYEGVFVAQDTLYVLGTGVRSYSIEQLLQNNIAPTVLQEEQAYLLHRSPFFDVSENLWIGTNGYGLRKYNANQNKFKHFFPRISGRRITSDYEGYIWIHQKLDSNHWGYQRIHLNSGKADSQKSTNRKGQLNLNLLIDSEEKNQWWLVKRENGIWLIKKNQAGKVEAEYALNKSKYLNASAMSQLLKDSKGSLWIGLGEGELVKFNPQSAQFSSIHLADFFPKINPRDIGHLVFSIDKAQHLWVGSNQGLFQGIPKEDKQYDWKLHQNNPENRQSLSSNKILSVLDDPKHPEQYLWIGTKGGGLNRLDKVVGTFEHFTTLEGLPNNVVYGILADEQDKLWMSTNKGLSNFDTESKTFQNFTSEDGLQSNEFNTNSYLKLADGRMIFGGVNGYNVFHPDSLKFNEHPPKVVLTSLKVNNQIVEFGVLPDSLKTKAIYLTQPLEQTKKIELAHHQNLIAIEYAALDFTDPIRNQYKYQLEGSDKDWIEVGTNRFALYSSLPPGNYTFKVMGTNNEGVWSVEPATLDIVIHPPWWKTSLAYAAYLGLAMWLLYQLYRFQINRAKLQNQLVYEQKEAERLAELDKLKTNFFSNITHEFRTPLTLIIEPLRQALPTLKNHKALQKIQLAASNSQKLLQLVNQLLDMSKLEGKKMELDLRRGDIRKTLTPILQSFALLAEKKGITLEWDFPPILSEFYYDKDKVEKIAYNLLSNAIKFTHQGGVKVHIQTPSTPSNVEIATKEFCLELKDSGIGIDKEQLPHIFDRFYQADSSTTRQGEGTGIGLALTKELVELMEGSIVVDSQMGEGTTFTLCLPMVQKGAKSVKNDVETMPAELPPMAIQEANLKINTGGNEITASPPMNPSKAIVLLIEDNAELRHFIQESLTLHYQVIESSNGAEGCRKAKELIPDLIVSDIMMPQKDGYQVCDELKNDALTSHIPIILLTAKSAIDSKIKGLRTGADAYLTKPFHTEELLVRIEKLITLRRLLQGKYSQIKNSQKQQTAKLFSEIDNDFLRQLTLIVEERLADESLTVVALANAVFMSRSQLFRKVKALTSQSPNEFVRNYRLDRAIELLRNKEGNVAEVATLVGFGDEKYFSTRFKERFGMSPSKVMNVES